MISTMITMDSTKPNHRSKRDLASECHALEVSSTLLGGSESLVSAIPIIGPIFGGVMTFANMAVDYAHIQKECDDIPFNEIKEIMDKRFSKLDRAIDRNYAAIQSLKTEMHARFDEVLKSINDLRIKPVLSNLKIFIDYFDKQKAKTSSYSRLEYISEIDGVLKFIDYLEEAIVPNDGLLHSSVYHIINQNFAIIESNLDNAGFLALDGLYNGVQSYVNVLFFLFKQHSYLADYYYGENDLENYNKQLSDVRSVFDEFKSLFEKNGLIDKAVFVLKDAQDKEFVTDEFKTLIESLPRRITTLTNVKKELENTKLPMILDIPSKLLTTSTLKFKPSSIETPIAEWKPTVRVKYAMQYRRDGLYSKVGPWSVEYIVGDKAFGTVDLPNVPGTTRLIFRKFDTQNNPELVGVVGDAAQTELWDINRDLYNAALMQNKDDTKKFIMKLVDNGADINASFDHGRKPLHAAAERNNIPMAFTLITKANANIDVTDDNGYTALHIAAELGLDDFIKMLLKNNPNVNVKTFGEELTPLHLAVRSKHLTTIKLLVKATNININLADKNGLTTLHYAIVNKLPITALDDILDVNEVDVNAVSKSEQTPLHYAVASGAEYVQALLNTKKVYVNKKTSDGQTALHLAATKNSVEIAEMLATDQDLNLDSPAAGELTPLHFATMASDVKMIEFFRKHNANVNARDAKNWTPLHYAVTMSKKDVVLELFKNEKIDKNAKTVNGTTPLHIAVGSGQKDMVLTLLSNGVKLEETTNDGLTPLHIASMHDNLDMFTTLLENKADIKAVSPLNKTVLALATEKGNLNVVKYLLDRKFPNRFTVANNEIQGLIDLSIKNGQADVLKYFIDGYKFEGKHYGSLRSLLSLAIKSSQLNVVRYLIEQKVNIAKDREDAIFFLEATRYNNIHIVRYILNKNRRRFLYNIYPSTDANGKVRITTGLLEAVKYGNADIAEYLLSQGAKPNFGNEDHKMPADIAKEKNLTKLYNLLQTHKICFPFGQGTIPMLKFVDYTYINDKCIDVKKSVAADIIQYTKPLHLAIHYGKIDIAKEFINHGANVNSQAEPEANTPAHLAAQYKQWDLLHFLIKKEADFRIKNIQNKKPYDIAKANGASGEMLAALNEAEHFNNLYTRTKRSIGASKDSSDKQSIILNYLIGKECLNTKSHVCLDGPNGNQDKLQLQKSFCLHENVAVGLLVLQTILDKKYPLPNLAEISPNEARLTAIQITEEFEALFRKAVRDSNVNPDDFDFYQLYSDIEVSIKKEKFSKVPEIMLEFIKKSCSSNWPLIEKVKNLFT